MQRARNARVVIQIVLDVMLQVKLLAVLVEVMEEKNARYVQVLVEIDVYTVMAKDANDVTCAGAQAPVPMVGVVSSAKVEE